MRRLPLAVCVLAAVPAAAYEEGAAVTNIHVDVANGTWPPVLVSPSVGVGLPYGFSLGGRVETNGLVPFLYTDTKLWLAYEPFFTRNSYDVGPGYSYPASGIRQRVGFALQGTKTDTVPVVVAGQYTNGVENTTKDGETVLNQSFDIEQPTLTSDVFYGGAELRPFANAAGPFAVLGAG